MNEAGSEVAGAQGRKVLSGGAISHISKPNAELRGTAQGPVLAVKFYLGEMQWNAPLPSCRPAVINLSYPRSSQAPGAPATSGSARRRPRRRWTWRARINDGTGHGPRDMDGMRSVGGKLAGGSRNQTETKIWL